MIQSLSNETVRVDQISPEIDDYLSIVVNHDELIEIESQFQINRDLITQNDEQNEIFTKIEDALLNKSDPQRIFVSGHAGTGKSFLIKTIKLLCKLNQIPMIVTAATGIAASLIGGKTIHSAFSIHSDINGTKIYLSLSNLKGLADKRAKVIIVDEITMISGDILAAVSERLNYFEQQSNSIHPHHAHISYQNKIILWFGDVAQVPAVTHSRDDFEEANRQFSGHPIFSHFTTFHLTRQMRQSSDEVDLLHILDEIRTIRSNSTPLSQDAQNVLRSRFLHNLTMTDQCM
jgi:ABC-type dipeptide/oligopeptide/nickel transport system ATPase component